MLPFTRTLFVHARLPRLDTPPLMKTSIVRTLRLILLQSLPPLGIKQGQNTGPECLQPLYEHVWFVTGYLSCASSNRCGRAQTEERFSPLKPSLPQCDSPDTVSGQPSACLTSCHPGPLPTGEMCPWFTASSRGTQEDGICWMSGLAFPHSTPLAGSPS